jgi:predicted ATP-dependent serine protease
MFKCSKCGKKYKTEKGLNQHENTCNVIDELPEEKETVLEPITAQETASDDMSEWTKRHIEKLQDLRKSTYDAETRHNIDMQIRELMGK